MTILTKPNVFVQIKKDMTKCPVADESIFVEEVRTRSFIYIMMYNDEESRKI